MAFAVDVVLLMVAIFFVALFVSIVAGPTMRLDPGADVADRVAVDRLRWSLSAALSMAASLVYFALPWRLWQATAGQRLLGLGVLKTGQGGGLPWTACVLRWVALGGPLWLAPAVSAWAPSLAVVMTAAAPAWLAVLLLTMIHSDSNRGLHDRLVGSVVLSKSARAVAAGEEAA